MSRTAPPPHAGRAIARRARAVVFALLGAGLGAGLGACHHAPPPAPPPAARPVHGLADVAGTWVADGALDWGYKLVIGPDGAIDAWIDRGKMGRCLQQGQARAAGDGTYVVSYRREECHPEGRVDPTAPVSARLAVSSFTGDTLGIVLTFGNGEERRTYRRMDGTP